MEINRDGRLRRALIESSALICAPVPTNITP